MISNIKILLLNVNSTSFFYEQLVIPFGLVSLASYIDDGGYEIKGIEMNSPPEKIKNRYLNVDKEILDEIKEFGPDIVAMSTYASNIYNVLFWATVIKRELPGSIIAIGGNHASYIAKECLEICSAIDIVVRFEGEIAFKLVCEKIKNNDFNFSDVPSITYRVNGEIQENEKIDFIKNIGTLPKLNRTYFESEKGPEGELTHADMISSRGCPFNCTFCNCNHYWSKLYRVRSIDSVVAELCDLKKAYPKLKSVRFRDEAITINKKHCIRLCEAIVRNRINIEFQAHSRLDGLDEEVIKVLANAGFKLLFIGMESGSMAVLQRIKKGIDISKAERVVALLRKNGIKFRISFMSSMPQERLRETMETVKLIKRLKLSRDEYYMGSGIQIYPGTQDCQKFYELNPDYRWLTKEYNFKGKYYGFKDPKGNILFPIYKEFGIIRRSFIFFILSPTYFVSLVMLKIKNVLNRLKFR